MSDTPITDALGLDDAAVFEQCQKFERENVELREALDDMVRQFAYTGGGVRTTGGLSALEVAFQLLGKEDPHPLDPWEVCDEPGCKEESTCGFPTPKGYRRTCGKHYALARQNESSTGGSEND